jgi:hypothetical protein
MVTQVGYSVAGWSRGRVALCAAASDTWRLGARVSWLSLKIKVNGL